MPLLTAEELKALRFIEDSLLGSILLAPIHMAGRDLAEWQRDWGEVQWFIMPEHFSDYNQDWRQSTRARLYAAMCRCQIPEIVSVYVQLVKMKQLADADLTYMRTLIDATPTGWDLLHYAQLLAEQHKGKPRLIGGIREHP